MIMYTLSILFRELFQKYLLLIIPKSLAFYKFAKNCFFSRMYIPGQGLKSDPSDRPRRPTIWEGCVQFF